MALNVVSPLLIVSASATPSAPPTGSIVLYTKSDGNLYILSNRGQEIKIN